MFRGSFAALITPFQNGQVDEVALRNLVNWHIEQGSNDLVPMGTTGQAPTATHEEHNQVVRIVVEEAAGRIPVIAGAGSNNPMEALEQARYAGQVGADAVLCVAGYYNRPSQEGLYQHFKFLHDQTSLPIIIYNIPPRAIVDILPETMVRLAELPRIAGVKDATKDLSRVSLERQLIDKEFSYLSGEDMTAPAYNAQGGTGCISVVANVAPALFARLQSASLQGDFKTALTIHAKLMPLEKAMGIEPSPAGVNLLGLCSEEVRLPIIAPGPATRAAIREALEGTGHALIF